MLDDGTALASGFVKDTKDYQGHLGFLTGVKKGKNEYRTITSVRNEKRDIKNAKEVGTRLSWSCAVSTLLRLWSLSKRLWRLMMMMIVDG